jgi:hypothetical protein
MIRWLVVGRTTMSAADRIAGIVCLGFAALLQAGGEFTNYIGRQIILGTFEACPHAPGVGLAPPPIMEFQRMNGWVVVLVVLGLILIAKSVVGEIRQAVSKHSVGKG